MLVIILVYAKKQGIVPVAGMELTTAEDIHVVCLFEYLEDAMAFDKAVDERRIKIPNRRDIFGDQLIMDGNDRVIGEEENLLSNATMLGLEEIPNFISQYNGICYPAHVDRESNGVIATLGDFPKEPGFSWAEFHDREKIDEYREKFPALRGIRTLVGSDAHYLWDLRDAEAYFDLEDEPYSGDLIRNRLFLILKGATV